MAQGVMVASAKLVGQDAVEQGQHKEKLEQLKAAREAGLIDDDEFAKKKEALLSDF